MPQTIQPEASVRAAVGVLEGAETMLLAVLVDSCVYFTIIVPDGTFSLVSSKLISFTIPYINGLASKDGHVSWHIGDFGRSY